MNDIINYKEDILPVIKKAGNKINNNFRFKRKISQKGISNYLTDLDKIIEKYVIDNVQKIYPNELFISEEENHTTKGTSFWVLDPIDGTTNLIHHYTSVCISLSHVIDNKVVFGVVYNPISHEMFYAIKGCGAYLQKNKIITPLKASNVNSLKNSIIGFGCPYDKSKIDYLFDILKKLINICDDLKRVGPASLDICYVACGRLDAYIELDLEKWDFSAGSLILSEAGGKITDFSDNSDLLNKTNIVASNSLIHDELMNYFLNYK